MEYTVKGLGDGGTFTFVSTKSSFKDAKKEAEAHWAAIGVVVTVLTVRTVQRYKGAV